MPKLTSASPKFYDLGRTAVDLPVSGREPLAGKPGRKLICPVKLIARASVCRKRE